MRHQHTAHYVPCTATDRHNPDLPASAVPEDPHPPGSLRRMWDKTPVMVVDPRSWNIVPAVAIAHGFDLFVVDLTNGELSGAMKGWLK